MSAFFDFYSYSSHPPVVGFFFRPEIGGFFSVYVQFEYNANSCVCLCVCVNVANS